MKLRPSAWWRWSAPAAAAILSWNGALAASPGKFETSLSERACKRPASTILAAYRQRDLGVVRCPAPKGFTILLVSSEANSWIDLLRGASSWSSEKDVVYREGAGMFPNVTGRISWLRGQAGEWLGFIFTVASRDEDDVRHLAHMAVRTVDATCLIGAFADRAMAERAIATRAACPQQDPPS